MKKTSQFDVMVVYSKDHTTSTPTTNTLDSLPFPIDSDWGNYNDVYAYFLETCQEADLTAAFASSSDIVSPGTCQGYWTYADGDWERTEQKGFAQNIFDKFAPRNSYEKEMRKVMFAKNGIEKIRPFNNSRLAEIFTDKLLTYQTLPDSSIPTVEVAGKSVGQIANALKNLRQLSRNHHGSQDFGSTVILKDRFGAGGSHIFRISKNFTREIHQVLTKHPEVRFVLQPFINFDQGFVHKGKMFATDIRLIFMGNKIVQTYIRTAADGDFRCNEHQGGSLSYVKQSSLPTQVIETAQQVARALGMHHSLYSLDFIVSNHGNVFLLEGNTGPGLDWDDKKKGNKKKSHELIQVIVDELQRRVEL